MLIRTAIIPTAGYGTRRLPITKTIEKNMLPVVNRPIIDYVIEECVLAGITDIYLVVNDIENSQIKDYYESNNLLEKYLTDRAATDKLAKLKTLPDGVNLHFVEQDVNEKYGTAVPLALAIEQCGTDSPVVFCNGDDPFYGAKDGSEVKTMVEAVTDPEVSVMLGYRVAKEEVTKYGMLDVNVDGELVSVIEKPELDAVTSDLVSINRIVMSPGLMRTIVNYVNNKHFGPRDQEYMVTDCYEEYIENGGKIKVVGSTGTFLDCGSFEGWMRANEIVGRDLLNK